MFGNDDYGVSTYEAYLKQAKENLRIAKARVADSKKRGSYYKDRGERGCLDTNLKACEERIKSFSRELEEARKEQREAKKKQKAREKSTKRTSAKTTSHAFNPMGQWKAFSSTNKSKDSQNTTHNTSKLSIWKGLLYFIFWPFLLIAYIFKLLFKLAKFICSLVFRW